MKLIFTVYFVLLFTNYNTTAQNIDESYISKWQKFYPSQALEQGFRGAVFDYEDRSSKTIAIWLGYNENILQELTKNDDNIDIIDARLLRIQAQSEVDKWKTLAAHTNTLSLYSELISNALSPMIKADYLLRSEKNALVCNRLYSIACLATQARENLKQVSKNDLEKGVLSLTKTLDYLQNDLKENLNTNGILESCEDFDTHIIKAIQNVELLLIFSKNILQENTSEVASFIGQQEYNRRLALYTDSKLTSEQLSIMALEEINTVKKIMAVVSKTYLIENYPKEKLPRTELDIINRALADMEKDAPLNATDYLQFWEALTKDAVEFIKEKDIATLPKNNTLRIQTAPESAGAAARIGWVASAPPFAPNPITTLNLPSIPETVPQQEQIDFWASFNKPFNRMIVIHELYPGHYMQLKISRETPHPLRLLFPYGIYIEGWATFTEKVLLDAGWEAGKHLTLLAHLRKRLENANRAYTSVQVHCKGWDEEQVQQFSTETSLLAPQFAKSLWGRIMSSPMQLTSYYLGGAQFTDLLQSEKQRLGDTFDLKFFMDTVMKAGPIPIDAFYDIFESSKPNK